jgi:hypothetical protein
MPAKPTRTAKQLHQMLIERIEAIPDLQGQVTDVHRGGVRWIVPVDDGPNWTVPMLTNRDTHHPDIARIIRQLQQQFDLED